MNWRFRDIRGGIWLLAIGAVLASVGAWLAASQVAPQFVRWLDARNWSPVEASLISVSLDESHRSRRPSTYEARARYRYSVEGRLYESDRVGLERGKDNIGAYQKSLHARLKEQARRGRPVVAWVDPGDPASVVLDRELRWGLLGLKALLAAIILAVGALFLFAGLRPPPSPRSLATRPCR
jgi:hypothetical protein